MTWLKLSCLFGHAPGSFNHEQVIRAIPNLTNGGTVFLDEIGEIGRHTKSASPRFCKMVSFRRVGEEEEMHADVRIIA